jgi:hypothetical protein
MSKGRREGRVGPVLYSRLRITNDHLHVFASPKKTWISRMSFSVPSKTVEEYVPRTDPQPSCSTSGFLLSHSSQSQYLQQTLENNGVSILTWYASTHSCACWNCTSRAEPYRRSVGILEHHDSFIPCFRDFWTYSVLEGEEERQVRRFYMQGEKRGLTADLGYCCLSTICSKFNN